MRAAPEPVLFLLALGLAVGLTWWKLDDAYLPVRAPSPRAVEAAELAAPPEVRLSGGGVVGAGAPARPVSAFSPPRELLPLEPLELPAPPLPALSVRRPAVQPSLAGSWARAYRIPPESLGDLVLEEPTQGGSYEAFPIVPPGQDLIGLTGERRPPEGEDPPAPPAVPDPGEWERRFDWVVRLGGIQRVYGQLLNADPHGLGGRPGEDLRLQQVSVRTGRPVGAPFVIPRDEVERFGLALTFENEAERRSRAMGTGPGAASARRALALELAAAWPEQARALELADREATRALAADPSDALTARLLATVRHLRGDLEGELAVYARAQQEGWADAPLLADHALLARRLGLPRRARQLLEQAERQVRASAPVLLVRGLLAADEGRHEQALVLLRKADTLSFPEPMAAAARRRLTLALGAALVATGQASAALREARRLLLEDPEDADGLLLQGAAHAAAGDLDAAADALTRALAAAPEDSRALTGAGIVAWRRADPNAARRLLEQARDVDPLRAVAPTLALGFLYEDAGEGETARDHYAQALELEPGHPEALYRMGRNQRLDGDPEAALETLREALRLTGPELLLLLELGRADLELGGHEAARRYFREALRLEPDGAEVHWNLGLAQLLSGDLHSARASLQAAVAGAQPGAHAALGSVAYRLGEVDAALDHFDELAKAYAGRGDHPQALYGAQQAARIRDHLSKWQWLDRFARSSLQRGWSEHQWDGSPHVYLAAGAVHVEGRMEKPREDERPGISRPVEGSTFHAAQAEVTVLQGTSTRSGLSLTYRSVKGAQGRRAKARLDVYVDQEGTVRASVLDNFDRVLLDGEPLSDHAIEPGQAVLLGIERLDAVQGRFGFTLGGRPVGPEVELKALRRFKNPFDLQVYAEAAPGRSASAVVSLVRVVQRS